MKGVSEGRTVGGRSKRLPGADHVGCCRPGEDLDVITSFIGGFWRVVTREMAWSGLCFQKVSPAACGEWITGATEEAGRPMERLLQTCRGGVVAAARTGGGWREIVRFRAHFGERAARTCSSVAAQPAPPLTSSTLDSATCAFPEGLVPFLRRRRDSRGQPPEPPPLWLLNIFTFNHTTFSQTEKSESNVTDTCPPRLNGC